MRVPLAGIGLFATLLPAQTFVVDANNGPGTNFTSIFAAIPTVPSGATLLVRPGAYQPFSLNNKALKIVGDPGVSILGTVNVTNTTVNQEVLLAGLDFTTFTTGNSSMLYMRDCQGPVILDRLTTPTVMPLYLAISPFWFYVNGLVALDCDQVVLRSSAMTNVQINSSTAVVESCTLRGSAAGLSPGLGVIATNALQVSSGACDIAGNTQLFGGGGNGATDGAGLFHHSSLVRMRSGSASSGMGGTGGWAIVGFSPMFLDPAVTLTAASSPPFAGPVTFLDMPSVNTDGAGPGGTMQATVETLAGDTVLLFVGLPGPPALLTGLPQTWWLQPTQTVLHAFGTQQSSAPITATTDIPNVQQLRGTPLAWQAITLNGSGLSMSNPSWAIVK